MRRPWEDADRAWQQLLAWLRAMTSTVDEPAGSSDSGDSALDALADVGTLRRLLDQAELVAVRAARRQRKSWAEIATQLGITRQSAWERWRDLDDDAGDQPIERIPARSPEAAVTGVTEGTFVDDVSDELVDALTNERRRRRKVVVPNVVGMNWDDARHVLMRKRLLAASHDPDGPPLAALGWPNTIVTDQIPEAGAKVPIGTQVRLWLERGGGSAGVREPRRPLPDPKGGYEWRDDPMDDAVTG